MRFKSAALILSLPMPVAGASSADAKGCIRGAVAGAVAVRYAHHHAIAGAAVGCAAGHYYYKHKARQAAAARAQRPAH